MTELQTTEAIAKQIHDEYGVTRAQALELAIKIRANEIACDSADLLSADLKSIRDVFRDKRFYA
jgi:hypothetical protein